jgi:ABC-type transport system involved in multi-copper enzyme maturation permease subunit
MTADPFRLAFAPYWRPGSVGWHDYMTFLAATSGISAALALLAVRTMRRACTRDVERRPANGDGPSTGPAARIIDRWGPSLDPNPVLWREWHRNRPRRWARVVMAIFVAGALLFSLMAIASPTDRTLPPWVNALQVSIGLLLVSVVAATSLDEERVRGSLDVLMTTPMETQEIVIGKWLGTYRLVPPLAILPVLVVLAVARSGDNRWWGAVVMAAFVLASGAAITSLGLAMATWCPRPGRALGLTVSVYLLVTVGWMFAASTLRGGPTSDHLMMGSPFFWAGAVTDGLAHEPPRGFRDAAFAWTLVYAMAAPGLLGATLATFNRCLGRVDSRDD